VYKKWGTPQQPGRDYVFETPDPLYSFGFGLSYTTFKYSNLTVTPKRILPAGTVTVRVDVTNTGKYEGKEVVQLYLRDEYGSVSTPVKSLKGFKKIALKPGQKKTVEFILTAKELALIDIHMQEIVEPGNFEVMIGKLKKKFTVL
jgi:beta-glucosidase